MNYSLVDEEIQKYIEHRPVSTTLSMLKMNQAERHLFVQAIAVLRVDHFLCEGLSE